MGSSRTFFSFYLSKSFIFFWSPKLNFIISRRSSCRILSNPKFTSQWVSLRNLPTDPNFITTSVHSSRISFSLNFLTSPWRISRRFLLKLKSLKTTLNTRKAVKSIKQKAKIFCIHVLRVKQKEKKNFRELKNFSLVSNSIPF